MEEAQKLKQSPDTFYALHLLDATGVVVVPGSGFGQKENTLHFRSTFLAPEEQMDAFIANIETFHKEFMKKYK